jgi:hypothetical protein
VYTTQLNGDNATFTAVGGSVNNTKGTGGGGMVKISYKSKTNGSIFVDIAHGKSVIKSNMNKFHGNGIFYGPIC